MAPENFRPARTPERRDDLELARIQNETARQAETVGDFRTMFKSRTREAIEKGVIEDESLVDERIDAVEAATIAHTRVRLDTLAPNVLGQNTIGGGREGMVLNRLTFAHIETKKAEEEITQTVEHEAAHGKQVELGGTLEIDGEEIDALLLYEGHAEIVSNEKIGKGINHHRDGQPLETYREGQDLAIEIIQEIGREKFERVLTETGDVEELQLAIDRRKNEGKRSERPVALAA